MRLLTRCAFAGLLGLGLVVPAAATAQPVEPIAVIVHSSNPISELSLDDLRRMYLGSVTIFETGERVALIESSEDRERFYRLALRMGEDRLKRYWVGRVFAGQAGRPPEAIRDPAEVVAYVARNPGAVAFVRADMADSTVKVLTIEGRRPSQVDYPIR